MTKKLQVFVCEVCGNIVEVFHASSGELTCCDQPMTRQEENVTDAAKEKHVPVVEKTDAGTKVKVGSVAHPMTDDHLIEWIEVSDDKGTCVRFLKPGEAPEAVFSCCGGTTVRAYCNLHGLWRA